MSEKPEAVKGGEMSNVFEIAVYYSNGDIEIFNVKNHNLSEDHRMMTIIDSDDNWTWLLLSDVQKIKFDERFSTIMRTKK